MTEPVFIPDNPPERQYTCPGCRKGIRAFRIGESSSYWIKDATDEGIKDYNCKYEGAIDIKLLGYKPQQKKDEKLQARLLKGSDFK